MGVGEIRCQGCLELKLTEKKPKLESLLISIMKH